MESFRLDHKPVWMHSPEAAIIFDILGEANARFVGGCVRDALLGKVSKDIDIATSLLPEVAMKKLKAGGVKVIPTGIDHGTITAVIDHHPFEITTLRKDIDCDGRHAQVEYTDNWEIDAQRRDFTINAMSCAHDGTIYDYWGGRADLEKGHVRFVGDAMQRCREDVLRVLRFFRFYAHYGASPVDATGLAACVAMSGQMDDLSGERIQNEMLKLLASPHPLEAVTLMQDAGVLRHLIPSAIVLHYMNDLIRLEDQLGRVPDALLRLAQLLRHADVTVADVQKLEKRWRLSRKDTERLTALVVPTIRLAMPMTIKEQKHAIRALGKDNFLDVLVLAWAEDPTHAEFANAYSGAMQWKIPVFPVSGKDVLDMGVSSGKKVGEHLRDAEEWWEEQDYTPTRTDILAHIKKHIAK